MSHYFRLKPPNTKELIWEGRDTEEKVLIIYWFWFS